MPLRKRVIERGGGSFLFLVNMMIDRLPGFKTNETLMKLVSRDMITFVHLQFA